MISIFLVCVSKSRLLTFLGNEFGELVTYTCGDRSMSTVLHTELYMLVEYSRAVTRLWLLMHEATT